MADGKSTVIHKLSRLDHPTAALTPVLLLYPTFGKPLPYSHFKAARQLQHWHRRQLYRAIEQNPDFKLSYTYKLNCPPTGYRVKPKTRVCQSRFACPWCYVRRVYYRVYQPLAECIELLQNSDQDLSLILWKRRTHSQPDGNVDLPFFDGSYGPHQWLKSLQSVQFCYASQAQELNHVGFHIAPSGQDLAKVLTRRAVSPSCSWKQYPLSISGLLSAISVSLAFSWSTILESSKLDEFVAFQHFLAGKQLVRSNSSQIIKHLKTFKQSEIADGRI